MRYSDEILDEIRNQLDIVEVIAEYVPLKPSGKGYKGLCPFHQEKTPSFMVDQERQIFHCFGCGEGGNIFSFIMKIEKMNFPEAVKILADKAGVDLPAARDQDNQYFYQKELILKFNDITADYYQRNLFQPQGKNALQYLFKRHFQEEVIKKYRIGYALPGYEHVIRLLLQKKFQLTDLMKAGLAVKSKKSGKVMDYFRNRIIFPIINVQGKIVAFGGRVLNDGLPKYINSPETPVYSKGRHLYGLYQARKAIREYNQVIIMEGYTDILTAYQYGFENVVASLGTALTNQQVDLLKRYTDEVIIAFDSDAAGKNATLRGLDLLKKAGLKVKIISLPGNSDPADILIEKGKDYFATLIKNSLPLIDYKLANLIQNYNQKTNEGKVSIVREIFADLSNIHSQMELQMEVKKIAEKLDLEEESILKDLDRFKRGNRTLPHISTKTNVESTHINAEKIIIGGMLQKSDCTEKICSELTKDDFSIKEHRDIVSIIYELFKKGEKISLQKVIDKLDDLKKINLLSEIIMKDIVSSDDEAILRSLNAIKKYKLKLELKKIRAKIKDEETIKNEVTPGLLQDYQNILHKIKAIV